MAASTGTCRGAIEAPRGNCRFILFLLTFPSSALLFPAQIRTLAQPNVACLFPALIPLVYALLGLMDAFF